MSKLTTLISGILSLNIGVALSSPEAAFSITENPLTPSKYWLVKQKSYPTNAWFINFALINNTHSEPVNSFPYLTRISKQGMGLSYSAPYYFAEPAYPGIISALFYQYENQLMLGPVEPMDEYGISSYHGMQVNLEWRNQNQQTMKIPLIQGSPYLTGIFTQTTPQLLSRFKWLSINKQQQDLPLASTNRYEIVLALDKENTQTWIVYSEYPLSLRWTTSSAGETLSATKEYSGWIRLVLQEDTARGIKNDPSLLDTYSQTIPLDYQQNYLITDKNLIYTLSWKTQNNRPPLMLSLAHQRQDLTQTNSIAYQSIKGLMSGKTQPSWTIELPLLPVLFLESKHISPDTKKVLRDSLQLEAKAFIKDKFPEEGPYLMGKRIARIARLILIANYLDETELQDKMLEGLKSQLTERMLEKGSWFFQYDKTWGGIIPSKEDYGARHYNDHHFHYGYWVYAFAVIAKLDPDWLKKPLKTKQFTPHEWISYLILDYANNDKNNPYFPLQRYQDDYAGHSWASGLTASEAGQNEQSSSEAVNAYYALALYAKATQDSASYAWAQFLMTRELRAAQLYWQIPQDSLVYSEEFKKNNQVIGNLWASKVDANAYFIKCTTAYRCGLQYSFGIQMLPFTAISQYLFTKEWLHTAYPTIKQLITGTVGNTEPAWQWILIKGISPIMKKEEKLYFFQKAIDSAPSEYDNGDSKTNTLFFLMNE